MNLLEQNIFKISSQDKAWKLYFQVYKQYVYNFWIFLHVYWNVYYNTCLLFSCLHALKPLLGSLSVAYTLDYESCFSPRTGFLVFPQTSMKGKAKPVCLHELCQSGGTARRLIRAPPSVDHDLALVTFLRFLVTEVIFGSFKCMKCVYDYLDDCYSWSGFITGIQKWLFQSPQIT